MSRPPLIFVPGFPASSLEQRQGHRKIFPPDLADLASSPRKAEILKALRGPEDPDADDGVDVRSPIRFSVELPLFDLGKEAQSLYDLIEDRFVAEFTGTGLAQPVQRPLIIEL